MNWLPTYLLNARGFSEQKMGIFAAATNLAGAIGFVLGGYICDKYFSERLRVPVVLGLITSAAFTYLAAIAPSGEWAVAALMLVFLSSNMAFTALFTLPLTLVPKRSVGAAVGIVNTAGQVAGVLAPLSVGYILDLTGNDFRAALYGMVALALVAIWPATRIQQA
jgi:nitrate/nitrite transporter NarK